MLEQQRCSPGLGEQEGAIVFPASVAMLLHLACVCTTDFCWRSCVSPGREEVRSLPDTAVPAKPRGSMQLSELPALLLASLVVLLGGALLVHSAALLV